MLCFNIMSLFPILPITGNISITFCKFILPMEAAITFPKLRPKFPYNFHTFVHSLGRLPNPSIHMMIDLELVQAGISRINDIDVRPVSRPACGIYSTVAPILFLLLFYHEGSGTRICEAFRSKYPDLGLRHIFDMESRSNRPALPTARWTFEV